MFYTTKSFSKDEYYASRRVPNFNGIDPWLLITIFSKQFSELNLVDTQSYPQKKVFVLNKTEPTSSVLETGVDFTKVKSWG